MPAQAKLEGQTSNVAKLYHATSNALRWYQRRLSKEAGLPSSTGRDKALLSLTTGYRSSRQIRLSSQPNNEDAISIFPLVSVGAIWRTVSVETIWRTVIRPSYSFPSTDNEDLVGSQHSHLYLALTRSPLLKPSKVADGEGGLLHHMPLRRWHHSSPC